MLSRDGQYAQPAQQRDGLCFDRACFAPLQVIPLAADDQPPIIKDQTRRASNTWRELEELPAGKEILVEPGVAKRSELKVARAEED